MKSARLASLAVVLILSIGGLPPLMAAENNPAASAAASVNALALELLRKATDPDKNAVLSPYSVQLALAMTYVGAAGDTRKELARVLHFPDDNAALQRSFAELNQAFGVPAVEAPQGAQLKLANRLFGQSGFQFREPALALLKDGYNAPLQTLDFSANPVGAAQVINAWTREQTAGHIPEIIPGGALNALTRLVLVNAVYFKDDWQKPFKRHGTAASGFHVRGTEQTAGVATMRGSSDGWGYLKANGYVVVTLPYRTTTLQFTLVVPEKIGGLPDVEESLTPGVLASFAKLPARTVALSLPKFKLQPPALALSATLKTLGIASAFNLPPGSANFDGFAPAAGPDGLFIGDVFHRAFIAINEEGAEAAAATAVIMESLADAAAQEPVLVNVDRPFLFAIQDRTHGSCLFLGRVVAPVWEGAPDVPSEKPMPKPEE